MFGARRALFRYLYPYRPSGRYAGPAAGHPPAPDTYPLGDHPYGPGYEAQSGYPPPGPTPQPEYGPNPEPPPPESNGTNTHLLRSIS